MRMNGILILFALTTLTVGCASSRAHIANWNATKKQTQALAQTIAAAREAGAEKKVPFYLTDAEKDLKIVRTHLQNGDLASAQSYIRVAVISADSVLEMSTHPARY